MNSSTMRSFLALVRMRLRLMRFRGFWFALSCGAVLIAPFGHRAPQPFDVPGFHLLMWSLSGGNLLLFACHPSNPSTRSTRKPLQGTAGLLLPSSLASEVGSLAIVVMLFLVPVLVAAWLGPNILPRPNASLFLVRIPILLGTLMPQIAYVALALRGKVAPWFSLVTPAMTGMVCLPGLLDEKFALLALPIGFSLMLASFLLVQGAAPVARRRRTSRHVVWRGLASTSKYGLGIPPVAEAVVRNAPKFLVGFALLSLFGVCGLARSIRGMEESSVVPPNQLAWFMLTLTSSVAFSAGPTKDRVRIVLARLPLSQRDLRVGAAFAGMCFFLWFALPLIAVYSGLDGPKTALEICELLLTTLTIGQCTALSILVPQRGRWVWIGVAAVASVAGTVWVVHQLLGGMSRTGDALALVGKAVFFVVLIARLVTLLRALEQPVSPRGVLH